MRLECATGMSQTLALKIFPTVKSCPKVMLLQVSSNEHISSFYDKQKSPIINNQDVLQTRELIGKTNDK